MILPSQTRLDILRAALRDAETHAEVWAGIAHYLENEIDNEENGPSVTDRPLRDADGVQFTYTSQERQGYDLSRTTGEPGQRTYYYDFTERSASTPWY